MMVSLFVAALLVWLGLAALCFATRRQYLRVCHGEMQRCQQIVLRSAGWGLLVLALATAIVRDGVSFGVLLWVALVGVLGMGFIVVLAYRPRLVFVSSGAGALSRLALRR